MMLTQNRYIHLIVLLWISLITSGISLLGQSYPLPQNPLEGQHLFVSKGCVKCHSIFGEGGTIGADLGRTQSNKKTMEIVAAMWNHSWEMSQALRRGQNIPQLDPQEMAGLLSFLYYLNYFDEPGSPPSGARLFREKHCIRCHSIGGQGGERGPALDSLKQYASAVFLAQQMWNHGRKMVREMAMVGVGVPSFKGNEMTDLLAYLQSISTVKAPNPIYMFPGDPERGALLFEEKGCYSCHQIDGRGTRVGPDLTQKKFHKGVVEIAGRMWNHGPRMWKKMAQKGIGQPILTGNDMADIIAFLYFLEFRSTPGNVNHGQAIFVEKGCSRCHSLDGEQKTIGPNLVRAKGLNDIITISSAMWNHNIKMQAEMRKRDIPYPRFSGVELQDLLAFIRSIREQENEQ